MIACIPLEGYRIQAMRDLVSITGSPMGATGFWGDLVLMQNKGTLNRECPKGAFISWMKGSSNHLRIGFEHYTEPVTNHSNLNIWCGLSSAHHQEYIRPQSMSQRRRQTLGMKSTCPSLVGSARCALLRYRNGVENQRKNRMLEGYAGSGVISEEQSEWYWTICFCIWQRLKSNQLIFLILSVWLNLLFLPDVGRRKNQGPPFSHLLHFGGQTVVFWLLEHLPRILD